MKPSFVFLFLLLLCSSAFSQTNQNQWMAGGSGSISRKSSPDNLNYKKKSTNVMATVDAGYFVLTNLAVGARAGYYYTGGKLIDTISVKPSGKDIQLSVAPFVRYYFLKPASRVNILADASYNWFWSTLRGDGYKYKRTTGGYSLAAGPAFFISPTSALELTVGYTRNNDWLDRSETTINIGFHQHLGKSKQIKKS